MLPQPVDDNAWNILNFHWQISNKIENYQQNYTRVLLEWANDLRKEGIYLTFFENFVRANLNIDCSKKEVLIIDVNFENNYSNHEILINRIDNEKMYGFDPRIFNSIEDDNENYRFNGNTQKGENIWIDIGYFFTHNGNRYQQGPNKCCGIRFTKSK